VTFFSRTSKGQLQTWSCWIEGDGITVTSTWGIKGGKMQMTHDTMTSRGKKGTLAYKSPKAVALEEHARQVEKKMRAGYVEAEARAQEVQLEKLKSELDFDKLPRSFAPAKPIREIAPEEAARLDKAGLLAVQRKRDGMRHYIVAGQDGAIRVYSRGMDDMTAHFTRLTQELTLPAGTILDCEFVVTTPKGADDFIAVSEICRSKPERAIRTMVSYERNGCEISFLVFDLLFYDRLPTWQLPYRERYNALGVALVKAHTGRRAHFNHVVVMPRLTKSLAQCIRRVQKRGWEGLVLWRADQATQVHLNRSPKRCNCYKFKPMVEGDFVATGYELGKGRNGKVVGALNLGIYGPWKAKWALIQMGNVGTGFSDQQRVEALQWKYPCVVEVKYEKMSETGLRFPSFLRKREDKKPKECRL
jgi:ATP-dependent DNA ligase